MSIRNSLILMVGGIVAAAAWVHVGGGTGSAAAESAVKLPAPAVDTPASPQATRETAVFAGGCFWGVQAVFQHTQGVLNAVSGYAGGDKSTASYKMIGSGRTGHAEAVHITYDPKQVSYGKLLQIYFSVAHDPTQLNRQGPDSGTQYRSAIFYQDANQKQVAERYIAQLDAAKVFPAKIVPAHAAGRAPGLLPGRGLPPGLRHAEPPAALHRQVRSAENRQPQNHDAGAVPRQAGAGVAGGEVAGLANGSCACGLSLRA